MYNVELLKAARAKIDKPEKWTQGAHARNEFGQALSPHDNAACKFCMVGAVSAVAFFRTWRQQGLVLDMLRGAVGGNIPSFNDAPRTTHADVLAAFDKAIALAEKEAADTQAWRKPEVVA